LDLTLAISGVIPTWQLLWCPEPCSAHPADKIVEGHAKTISLGLFFWLSKFKELEMKNFDTGQSFLDPTPCEVEDIGRLACLLEDHHERPEMTVFEATAVEPFVKEFNAFGKLAAKHIILQRRTVARAKASLNYEGFGEFCCQVGLDPKSSKCRKYQRIGAEADWLLPIADGLPPDWTTIYALATLGQNKVEELIRLGKLHPETTAKQLRAATNANGLDGTVTIDVPEEADIEAAETCVYVVDASDLPEEGKLALYCDLEMAAARHGLTVTGLSNHLAERLIIEREAAQ
jgi:hypothetical protein